MSDDSCFACKAHTPTTARRLLEGSDDPFKERAMAQERKDGVEGEGSYSGTKDYNQRTEKFIKSGKVDQAAHDAEPKSEEEKQAMQKAERVGKQHAKGEDPALKKNK
jgi:hypothetical protein